ncbi:MAG TPA: XdhC family protein [Steroidobacteraceae bacterium]|nr:XdhC family protein [Steroidobacteraceae bacterium]
MSTSLQRLLPLFQREHARAEAMVLATVVHTAGPTYTKPGAQMLIARGGEYAGLLSGGCLEGDLSERAKRVLTDGSAEVVRYDMRSSDELLFGLGSGCEGDMEILLQRLDASTAWQPLLRMTEAWAARCPLRLLLIVRAAGGSPPGTGIFLGDGEPFGEPGAAGADALRRFAARLPAGQENRLLTQALPGTDLLVLNQSAPPRVLLMGAGADALPLAQLVTFLGWSLTVVDHRSHYAQAARFESADAVLDGGVGALSELLRRGDGAFDAAVVMSHHLLSDLAYLRVLAASEVPYVGLLGPASRRDRLLQELGAAAAARLQPRLRAPVGLDLGAASPEAIALAIVAEIQGFLAGDTTWRPLSLLNDSARCMAPVAGIGNPAVGESA